MTSRYLVEILKKVVLDASVDDMLSILENPPGRNPSKKLLAQSSFYEELSELQKSKLKELLEETAEMTLFGLLCVLDGVRAIENRENKGTLELWYRNGDATFLLNDSDGEFLHDLM